MRRKISITQKHFIYFLFLSLASIILVAYYSYYVARISILERTFNQLTSVRVEKTKNIERFFYDRIQEIEILSQSLTEISPYSQAIFPLYQSMIKVNLIDINSTSNLLNFENIKLLSNYVKYKNYFNHIYLNFDANTILKIDSNTTEKVILNDSKILKEISNKINSNHNDNIFFLDYTENERNDYSLFLIKKIDNDSSHNFIAFELRVSGINNIIFDPNLDNGLGKSGEAYIVGSDLLLRTSSRFKDNSIKNVRVETIASKEGNKKKSGTKIIKDYRNIDVLSSYSPLNIKDLNWVIIAEIDYEEALGPIYNLRDSIIILSLVLSIFIFGLVYYGSTKLTNPIIELKEAAVKISKGDYNSIIENKFNDELGELVDSFNLMSEQLKIQKEQIQIDKKNRLSSIIDAQEKERQRLSRDLHDGLGQMLMAIKLKIEQAKVNSEKSKKYITDSLDLIKNTIADLRSISNDLMPSVLINFGLKDGLQKLCRDSSENSGIIINFECNNIDNLEIENKYQIYIYRIIQELVNNILKHANAKNAEIIINYIDNKMLVRLKDDGIGFDSNKNYNGNGLNNISDRVELLNGKLEIYSNTNIGTEININIPLNYGKN